MDKQILVAGGAGYIGSHCAPWRREADHRTVYGYGWALAAGRYGRAGRADHRSLRAPVREGGGVMGEKEYIEREAAMAAACKALCQRHQVAAEADRRDGG